MTSASGGVRAANVVWAIGFGLLVAFYGGVVSAPPDPLSQLLWAVPFVAVTVPGMYLAITRARGSREQGGTRLLVGHFVTVTLVGSLLAVGVGALVAETGPRASLARALAFAGTFLAVTWLFYGRE